MPIGPLELGIILVIALLILGPGKLPEVGSAFGKTIREFRKASSDIQESVKIDASPAPSQSPQPPQTVQAAPPPAPAAAATPAPPGGAAPAEPATDAAAAREPVESGTASSADPAARAD